MLEFFFVPYSQIFYQKLAAVTPYLLNILAMIVRCSVKTFSYKYENEVI